MANYILVDKKPVPEPDTVKWAKWYENIDHRRVAEDRIGHVRVSTVFLGIDHNFWDEGSPILFETMVFDMRSEKEQTIFKKYVYNPDLEQDRYRTWDEAIAGHQAMVEKYRNEKLP